MWLAFGLWLGSVPVPSAGGRLGVDRCSLWIGSVIGWQVSVPVSFIICENTKREKSEKMKKGGSQGGRPYGILFKEGDNPTQRTEQNAQRREKGENNGKGYNNDSVVRL